MKKFLYGCLIVLIAASVSIVANGTLMSCENPVIEKITPSVNKAQVSACLDSIVNPMFSDVNDVFELQQQLVTNAFVDSVFMSLSKKTLNDIYGVLSKKRPYLSKDDIVGEYLQNRNIYENLPQDPPDVESNSQSSTTITPTQVPGIVHEETTTVTEAPPTRVEGQRDGSYKDTVIDGKHAIIKQ